MGLIEAEAVDKLLYEELPMKFFYGRSLNTAVKNQAAIRERVAQIPTVDAVPVVRCKDCKHAKMMYEIVRKEIKSGFCCTNHNSPIDECCFIQPDWFCADGERREDG